jgi:hypothetical protein
MPSRLTIVCIILFWVGAVTWLFFRDILPRLLSNEPTFFIITKADEFPTGMDVHPSIGWLVTRNDRVEYNLTTAVSYSRRDDVFQFRGNLAPIHKDAEPLGPIADHAAPLETIRAMDNVYIVERTGRLVSLRLNTAYTIPLPDHAKESPLEVRVDLSGEPVHGKLSPVVQIKLAGLAIAETIELEPVELSRQGFILNPLHPLDHITELHPGQTWNGPVIDPFCLGSLVGMTFDKEWRATVQALHEKANPLQLLPARVQPVEDEISWLNDDVPCRVIEYGTEGSLIWVRIWVRSRDGLVLKQQAELTQGQFHDVWTFERIKEP